MAAQYRPARAWGIACGYFLLVATFAYALQLPNDLSAAWTVFEKRIATWQGVAIAVLYAVFIVLAYAGIWARGSFIDGRARHIAVASVYGVLWGLAQGLMFLGLAKLVQMLSLPSWAQFVVTYLVIAAFTGIFHSQFWDVWVSPPHNYREWNLPKVLFCHTPNLIIGLSLLIWWQMDLLFLLMQVLALLISAVSMHFPPWWSQYRAVAGEQRSAKAHA